MTASKEQAGVLTIRLSANARADVSRKEGSVDSYSEG